MKCLSLITLTLGLVPLVASYPAYNFSVPVDHFHNESRYEPHTNDFFNLRYWFDASHYKEGGPIFLLAGGEDDASLLLPILSHGIFSKLVKTYNGIGVILEHRYYGTSFPVNEITPESLRFLTTEQAMADYAYFASHITLPGLEQVNLTAQSGTPWIAYGVSYAGGFVSFLRKLYPDIYYGAISSSGTTAAVVDYWKYYEPIRHYGPPNCIKATQDFVDIIDHILINHEDNQTLSQQLKTSIGASPDLPSRTFALQVSGVVGSFQNRNWDPAIGAPIFREYCDNITSSDLLYPETSLAEASIKEIITIAGYNASDDRFVTGMLNQAGYYNHTIFKFDSSSSSTTPSPSSGTTHNKGDLHLSKGYSWFYQLCTEWGNYYTGAGTPSHIRPLVSRLIDVATQASTCPLLGIKSPPDVERINRYGGLHFSYPRVAMIGGLADPWRDVTPLAEGLPLRPSTDDEPVILIDLSADEVWDGIRGAVHHWELNGATTDNYPPGLPPKGIVEAWDEIVRGNRE
ncbi:hypothetical protein EYZ11_010488 [Aspergillus tanneri]|uniref:Thymus-specific serine protease n=1 Tax=Aspergillus tanneri TaxID=1220188 RepID=A0A4S3J7D7_9EURO|nr:hypothetical protein EYZ11_010488 [Aspergillus tanneri]